jgi:methyl-accepting chemotaxis protein
MRAGKQAPAAQGNQDMSMLDPLLGPGKRWMRLLQMPTKLALLAAILVVPLLLLIGLHGQRIVGELAATRAELEGARLSAALADTVFELQIHRGLTQRLLAGDASAGEPLQASSVRLKSTLGRADELQARTRAFALGDRWPTVQQASLALTLSARPPTPEAAWALHGLQIEALRRLMQLVGERSGLMIEAQAAIRGLISITVERTVDWAEALARADSQGSTQPGRAEALAAAEAEMAWQIAALQRAGVVSPPSWAAAHARSQSSSPDLVAAFEHDMTAELDLRLQQRAASLGRQLAQGAGVLAAGGLLLAYLLLSFHASFAESVSGLGRAVAAMEGGDMAQRVSVVGRDELSEVARGLERMGAGLSAMVAGIRSSAVRVGLSGRQLAQSGDALAERTEVQAASLRQTMATVSELSVAVAANAQAAHDLDLLTHDLADQAAIGGKAMHTTVDVMGSMEGSSRRVGEIVGVIDGIAFQTNILALNAAVEAARAGEAGRGFAVVATEVRRLAQHSAAAASEIRQLIGQSTEQVGLSVTRMQGVNQTLGAVVEGVRTVSQRLRGIAQASSAQSAGLEQVTQCVAGLDEITGQNARMVEESSTASAELVGRATALAESVASIKLRQGSADEAQAMVVRALALVRSEGLDNAARTFHQTGGPFLDRDLYVFVVDRDGRYRVHGAKPAMEGHRVHELPGIDGDRFTRESWAATAAAGWVEYDIVNPETGTVQPKASYVQALDQRLLLGCGIYRT